MKGNWRLARCTLTSNSASGSPSMISSCPLCTRERSVTERPPLRPGLNGSSVTVCAEQLVGFVHACWDGGAHAFVLDTAVDPHWQHDGIGTRLVRALIDQATAAGCEWLHVDYEPDRAAFYTDACGFDSTSAGLRRLVSR